MRALFIFITLLFFPYLHRIDAKFKRCFSCRSRGVLGDCKDPFHFNSTTFNGQTSLKPSIEESPCASGWCAKSIEADFGDSIVATERWCMMRPPTDNSERCSDTILENQRDRKVFLCMCYGDLCNTASTNHYLDSTNLIATAFLTLLNIKYSIQTV